MAIVILRTVIVFACIIAAMRLMGKRQLGELELSELVVAVLISDMAAHPLQDIGIPLLNGIIPIFVLLFCEIFISFVSLKSAKFKNAVFGSPSILILNGEICQHELKKNRFSIDELFEQLRKQGITDVASVRCAVLETDGNFSVIQYARAKPPDARACGVSVTEKGVPVSLIIDGRVQPENLRLRGKDMRWLSHELNGRGVSSPGEVYYMSVDDSGAVFFARRDKKKG